MNQLNHAGYVFKHRHDEVQGKLRIWLTAVWSTSSWTNIARFIHAYPQVQLCTLSSRWQQRAPSLGTR